MKSITRAALALCLAAGTATGAQAVEFTGVTGSAQSFSNYQASLVLGSYVQTDGYFPQRPGDGGAAQVAYLGAVRTFAFRANRLEGAATGQIFNISQNPALYTLTGATYGGDGRTTFALPNLAGATMVGAGGGTFIGQAGGTAVTTLTGANLPAHDHDLADGRSTSVAGAASPAGFDNRQPSLTLNYGIAVNGLFGASLDVAAIGEVRAFAGGFVPGGYMAADGREMRIAEYTALYNILGTTYGGDGVTTFRLPDLAKRAVVGATNGAPGVGSSVTNIGLGEKLGADTNVLTAANLPAHAHTLPGGGLTGGEGQSQAITQEQASLGLNYMIALQGVFPSFDSVAADYVVLGEISAFAGRASAVPNGWTLADGRLLSIRQNTALFSLIGTTYGGDGVNTFALPDLRGRAIVGAGNANGTSYTVGQQLGTSRMSLTSANMPAHNHAVPDPVVAPVPEPATWGLMLLGFGMVGAGLRSRRRSTTVTYA